MAEILPFDAIRYDTTPQEGDLSPLLAPPYDVLDQADKDALLVRNPHNIVAIDLPHIPPKSLGPAQAYENSARLLARWQSQGILVREARPALYLYEQRFEHGGDAHTRHMFIARARLRPFSDGVILPHEQTFGGPKEDRLALMKATRCNLSPVFGLYADPDNQIRKAFENTAKHRPDATATLDGARNRLWIVHDRAVIEMVTAAMEKKRIYIADGHHRYGTALTYRDEYVAAQGPSVSPDHPVHYVMIVLASMDDPGCLILPYHRALGGVDLSFLLEAWSPGTTTTPNRDGDIVLFDGRTEKEVPLRFTNRALLKTLEADRVPAWYDLDLAYLHRYLINELLRDRLGHEPAVRYVKSKSAAQQAARDESGVALFVRATPMAQLRTVSEQGGLMPPKSTYFYPKLATGLTINPLE